MTNDEALKLALEALENNKQTHYYCEDTWYSCPQHEDGCANDSVGDECNCGADKANAEIDKVITAIKEALAQHDSVQAKPEPEQEPFAYVNVEKRRLEFAHDYVKWDTPTTIKLDKIPLYTTPPQRTWVDLTRKEFAEILCDDRWRNRPELMMLQVQAKLKEKNRAA